MQRSVKIPRVPRRTQNDITFEGAWAILGPAFDAIHFHNQSKLSFEELWRVTYNLLLRGGGDDLYKAVVKAENEWLHDHVRLRITKALTTNILADTNGQPSDTSWREVKSAGERLLKTTYQQYHDHQTSLASMSDILSRMDRDYYLQTQQPTFHEKGTSAFRDVVLGDMLEINLPSAPNDHLTVLRLITLVMLDQIHMSRQGEEIDHRLLRSIVRMLDYLPNEDHTSDTKTLYTSTFETAFLESSTTFFKHESEFLLKSLDARTFCQRVKSRLLEEQDRCRTTLLEQTAPRINKIVENEMIRNNMRVIVNMDSGARYMTDNDQQEDIKLLYVLESRVDQKKTELTNALKNIIADLGASINRAVNDLASTTPIAPTPNVPTATPVGELADDQAKGPVDKSINVQTTAALRWVEDILALKDKFDVIWRLCLYEDKVMQTVLTRSVANVINSFSRCSEYISLFIDDHMKKGIKGKSEAEVDAVLSKAITLVRYLEDKDIFEKYYKKHLCKRLLMARSISLDVEKSMIGRMKIELGNSFTTKLEAMFKDMSLSEELTSGYKKHVAGLGQKETRTIDLNISVLTSMTWPLETMRNTEDDQNGRLKTIYPPAVDRLKASFEQFYAKRYSGRVLSWQANMGTADIKATFPKVPSKEGPKTRTHELNVSTYAMIVLVLFNDLAPGASLSYEDIQEKTRIPTNELIRNLQSLAVAPKTRILLKQPMSKDVKPTDRFIFNESFQGKFVKIKVGVVTAGNKVENDRERKETESANDEARGFAIEAAVVRIMKQRKELSHAQLVSETLTHLSAQFKPDVGLVKKKIESLIEREYLERMDEAAVPSYRYLA